MTDNDQSNSSQELLILPYPTRSDFEKQWGSISWRERPFCYELISYDGRVFLGFTCETDGEQFGIEMPVNVAEGLASAIRLSIAALRTPQRDKK